MKLTLETFAALALLLSPALLAGSAVRVDPGGPPRELAATEWLRPAPSVAAPARAVGPEVVRRRGVRIDTRALARLHAGPGSRVQFGLFDDVVLDGTVTRRDRPGAKIGFTDSYALSGRLDGDGPGSFDLVVHRGVVAGRLSAPGRGSFQIRAVGTGRHEVREIDEAAFETCGVGPQAVVAGDDPVARDKAGAGTETDGSRLDVMIVYTPSARDEMGGTAAVEAEAMLAVTVGNTAFENSAVNTRLVLVHLGEVNYVETGDGFLDLQVLSSDTDGTLDEVHAIRDAVQADNVGLFVDSTLDSCGIAWVIRDFPVNRENYSFNVSAISCAAGNLTYIHEVGHNLGSAHDHTFSLPDAGVFPYSFGHFDPDLVFRTVMALPNGSPRVAHFSNPQLTYADTGRVTGAPAWQPDPADNARGINQTAYYIANYRQSICPAPVPELDCNNNCIDDFEDVAGGVVPDCNGNGIPDFCEVTGGASFDCNGNRVPDECEDCNGNGIADACEFAGTFSDNSGRLGPIGAGSPVTHTFVAPPEPAGFVDIRVQATADLGDLLRSFNVFLNDSFVGQIFRGDAPSCTTPGPSHGTGVTAEEFLSLTGGGDAVVRIEASGAVDPFACAGTSSLEITLAYDVVGAAQDANGNELPDECDQARGDNNLDGFVDIGDLLNLLAAWGGCPAPCPPDTNADGVVDIFDLLNLLASWD